MTSKHDKAKRWQFGLRRMSCVAASCAVALPFLPRQSEFYASLIVAEAALIGIATFCLLIGAEALCRKLLSS